MSGKKISFKTPRHRRKIKVRRRIKGSEERPRLCVFRSNKHIYAQLIVDGPCKVLASVGSLSKESKSGSNVEAAKSIGEQIAKKALEKDIKEVVFDRNGYVYHGRVAAVADGAREAGLKF